MIIPEFLTRAISRLVKAVALFMALTFTVAFGAYKMSDTPIYSICGGKSWFSTATNLVIGVADINAWVGGLIHDFYAQPDSYATVSSMEDNFYGTLNTMNLWWHSFSDAVQGKPKDPYIVKLADAAKHQAELSLRSCIPCPGLFGGNSSGSGAIGTDTTVASDESGTDNTNLSGKAMVQAVAQKYWPADQVAVAVAVAGAESTYKPTASNGTHFGLWQIAGSNIARNHWDASRKFDPDYNAWMAHEIWRREGGTWAKDWTTYQSGAYKSFMSSADQTAAGALTTTSGQQTTAGIPGVPGIGPAAPLLGGLGGAIAGCAGGGSPGGNIITWNAFHGSVYPHEDHNNDQRVVDAMVGFTKIADIINIQELSDPDRKRKVNDAMDKAGFAFVAEHTSHEVFFRRSKYTLVSDDTASYYERGDNIEGPDQGDRYIVTAVLRDNTSGQTMTDINMHNLPHIQEHGVLNPKEPHRIAVAIKGWSKMQEVVRSHITQGQVVVCGDMNFDGDPRGMYAAVGLHNASNPATHGKRTIDQILYTSGTPVSDTLLGKFGSDHAARMVSFAQSTPNEIDATDATGTSSGTTNVVDPTSKITYAIKMPADPKRVAAMTFAFKQLGKPYVWGAKGPNSYDCSGLMHAAWGAAGVDVYPQTETLVRQFQHVGTKTPGDMLYHPGHVQMYVGTQGGKDIILEAPRPGRDVMIRPQWMTPTAILDPTKPVT